MREMTCERCVKSFWEVEGVFGRPRETRAGTRMTCPWCAEAIRPDLSLCPSCGGDLDDDHPPIELSERVWQSHRRLCARCHRAVYYEAVRCPGCRESLQAHDGLLAIETPVAWHVTSSPQRPFRAQVGAADWTLLANDYPAEPRFTLLVDGHRLLDLDDWPPVWTNAGAGS
ncbi:MAG: hypothetical protein HYZ53_19945 [Planctomycetes bacterium]|nr:hypothetical protein [Planctomycetota bacterium]